MKKIINIAIIFLITTQAKAQFATDYVKSADAYFKKGDYYSAAQYYEKYLGTSGKKTMSAAGFSPYTLQTKATKGGGTTTVLSTKEQVVYNIAECYRHLNFPAKAEPAYAEVLLQSKDKFPLVEYQYGLTLRALQKYTEAETQLNNFLKSYTTNDINKTTAEKELKNLQFIQTQINKNIDLYKLNKLATNEDGANYAASFINEQVLFTSTRKDTTNVKAVNNNQLYFTTINDNAFGAAQKIAIPQTESLQQGAATSTDGNTIYFTQWEKKTDKKNASIYMSSLANGVWSEPAMVEALNIDGYNTQQPFIVGNNVYFASDRPNGVGGMDLYVATLENGKATNIQNLGFNVNTVYDEVAPYYNETKNTLVFSSNGHIGMGGQDFFYSKKSESGFTTPVNFGTPVNSVKEDVYFTAKPNSKNLLDNVIISSDRNASCCLELYALQKATLPKQISGTVVSCESKMPIANATVKITDANNAIVTTLQTNEAGQYNFTLEEFKALKATANFEGLVDGVIEFNAPMDADAITLNNPQICLDKVFPPPPGQPIVLDNVYFDYEKWALLSESSTTLDYLVQKLNENPEVKIEIGGHTDSNGEDDYNQVLSQRRAEACVKYIISKGIDKSRLTAKGYGETQPLSPNTNDDGSDNPEGRAKNRRTAFTVIK